MPTRTPRHAGRTVSDAEVKTTLHDNILHWLAENLGTQVATRLRLPEAAFNAAADTARSEAQATWDDTAKKLRELQASEGTFRRKEGEPAPLSAQERLSLEQAALHFEGWVQQFPLPVPDESLACARLQSHELMKMVNRIERKQSRYGGRAEPKVTPAGFVDLAAEVFVPQGLRVGESLLDSLDATYGYLQEDRLAETMERVQRQMKRPPSWTAVGCTRPLLVTVRSTPFTLGEVLQELKTLATLEDGNQVVALAVDGIAQEMRQHIESEGFLVFCVDDHR